jgi:hypothetical protein
MKLEATPFCAICLEENTGAEGWLLLTENRWTDRLKILGWNDSLASQPGIYAVCGAAHAEQLVIHWMVMGTLDYPFARLKPVAEQSSRKSSVRSTSSQKEPDISGSERLGELAVHRESLERILVENRDSLGSILSALMQVLEDRQPRAEATEDTTTEEGVYA